MIDGLLTFWIACLAWGIGIFMGGIFQKYEDADAQLSDPKPKWWRNALINAKARKDKEEGK